MVDGPGDFDPQRTRHEAWRVFLTMCDCKTDPPLFSANGDVSRSVTPPVDGYWSWPIQIKELQ
jgi:hypothetical protein